MAKVNNERTEREFQLDVNAAVANTETEIFDDALGDEPLDNDGDTSLEEMGEGLEGDDLEEEGEEETEEEADEEGGEEEEAEGDEAEEAEGDETAEDEEEEQPRDQRGRFEDRQPADRRGIPSSRLREEAQARRDAEERSVALERQLAEMNGRMAELSARVNAPPPKVEQQRPPKPDQFADPEGHEKWMQDEFDRKLEERSAALRDSLRQEWNQQQQQQRDRLVEETFARAANGPRKWDFKAAYGELVTRNPQDPRNQQLVQSIQNSRDPAAALFEWWDEYTADEAVDYRSPRQESRQRSQQPRHETRLPESLRRSPPSLNSARGGQRQETTDPEMMDDSDEAVARYAFRR